MLLDIISKAKNLLDRSNFDWAICGGAAIDLYVGKITRTHIDLDVAVFWEDRGLIIDLMLNSGWRVFEACGNGIIHEIKNTNEQSIERRNLFCFTKSETRCQLQAEGNDYYRFKLENREINDLSYMEFLFNQRDEQFLILSEDNKIKRNLSNAVIKKDEVPLLSPEVVLLYKSSYLDYVDASKHYHDFNITLPLLELEQRQWLKKSIEILHSSNHEWLMKL